MSDLETAQRVYELDALLFVLEDLVAPLQPTEEQRRRATALTFLAGRVARDAVAALSAGRSS